MLTKQVFSSKHSPDLYVHNLFYYCRDALNGELNPKNGDAYFLYGRALLEYAIQRNSVLGQSAKASAEEVEIQQVEAVAPSGKKKKLALHVSVH